MKMLPPALRLRLGQLWLPVRWRWFLWPAWGGLCFLRVASLPRTTLDYSLCVTSGLVFHSYAVLLHTTIACRGHPEHIGTTLRQHHYSEHDAELNGSQRTHLIPIVTTLLWLCASLQAQTCDEMQQGSTRPPRVGLGAPLGYPPCHFLPSPQWWQSWGGLEQSLGKEEKSAKGTRF